MAEWIPSEKFLKLTFPKWNGRKILAEIRKNIKSITSKTFNEGLDRVLAAAAREKDMAVLQEILPLSFNCHPLGINHLYDYWIQTEKKHLELIYGTYSFHPSFSWMRYFPSPGDDLQFVPCVDLQGTLLHIAAHAGSFKMVEFLHQQHDANLNATNCCGRTPLMVGVHNTEVALYLINNGCNVNHQDRWGHTVLMLTAWRAKTCKSLLKPLLAAGADPKIVDKYGKTFVHYVCELAFDGDCIPYVIENNIFDMDCQDNGSVFYAGRPIIFTHDFLSIRKAIRKMPSPPGAVFNAYLDLCELMSIRDMREFKKCLPSAFKSIKEKGSPSYSCAPPNALYGNRKEVTSEGEFNALLRSTNDLRLEYLYQHLIIAERITGAYSLEAISYLQEIIVCIHNSGRNAILTAKLLCLFMKRVSMYCETYLATKSVLKSLLFFETSMFESYGFTSEEHKALLSEFLTSYVSLIKNLASADLHVHRYCHNPARDVPVVLYGSCYMELLNSEICCKAAYIMSYYIYQSIKGEIPQLEEGLIKDMIQSCEVHPFSPFIHSAPKPLVQPSTMLYSFLSEFNITNDILIVCSKILEVSTVDLVNAFVPDRSTMLHFAVERDSPELVEFLLSHNAHPDAVDNQGNPPLAIASSSNAAIWSKLSVPNRLECIASKRVIEAGIPYQNIGLPKKVVKLINLHDKNRFLK